VTGVPPAGAALAAGTAAAAPSAVDALPGAAFPPQAVSTESPAIRDTADHFLTTFIIILLLDIEV
jgi:hypothetical protein